MTCALLARVAAVTAVAIASGVPSASDAASAKADTRSELVSIAGPQDGSAFSQSAISADGRYVIFSTGSGPQNQVDAFIRDRALQRTARIEVGIEDEGLYFVTWAAMSADADWIAVRGYDSSAGDWVLFLYERRSRLVRRIASAGRAALSGNGRFLLFATRDALVPGDIDGVDLYVYDRTTRAFELVPTRNGTGGNEWVEPRGLSADGRYVLFESCFDTIVEDDANRSCDVFRRDRVAQITRRVSVSSAGVEGNSASWNSTLSADGRYVAFTSAASNLVPGDTNNQMDVFVHDVSTRKTSRVSIGSFGAQADGGSQQPAISGNGRLVAFSSWARNLVHDSVFGSTYVHDRTTGVTRQADVESDGRQPHGGGGNPAISGNGRFVTFSTWARLEPADTDTDLDVYVRDLGTMTVSDRLASLKATANLIGAPVATRGALVALIDGAQAAAARPDRASACRDLASFAYAVQGGWNIEIPSADAVQLFATLARIEPELGCPARPVRAFDFLRSRFPVPQSGLFGVAAGDFNRDGHVDAAVTHDNSLSVLKGDGHASFQAPVSFPTGKSTRGLIAADLDADGRSDLVAANSGAASISVFLSRSGGSMMFSRKDLPAGRNPFAVAAADITADGLVDLAVANAGDDFLSLFKGLGHGRFASAGIADAGYWTTIVHLVDMNDDGVKDLVTGGYGALSILLNDGDGNFSLDRHVAYDDFASAVVADFNRDGRPDLAATTYGAKLRLFMSAGDGSFDEPSSPDIPWPYYLAAADFNGDNRLDLAVTNYIPSAMWIVQGNGDGTFGVRERFDGDIGASAITAADLNHDKAIDLLVLATTARTATETRRSSSINALVNRPVVFVETPNDATNWAIGSAQTIGWRHRLPRGTTFRVDVSRDGGSTWKVIAPSVSSFSASPKFSWQVTGPATERARFRVTATGGARGVDLNDAAIRLSDPFVRLAGLNRLEWGIGTTQTIRWEHNVGARVPMSIELSRDGGATWTALAHDVLTAGSSTGSWQWTVSGPATSRASIRVRASNGVAASGTLDGVTIAAPFIRVRAVQPATPWSACEGRTVRWVDNLGRDEAVELQASGDGGGTWRTWFEKPQDQHVRYWPDRTQTTVHLRVRWVRNPDVASAIGPYVVSGSWCDDDDGQ